MTATTETRSARDVPGLTFRGMLHSEWVKLRSLRSTFWCLLVIVAITIGFGLLLAATFSQPEGSPPIASEQAIWVQVATAATAFSQLVAAVLGVLVISGEYGTGMIRSTFAAAPRRTSALVAKAVVVSVTMFVVGLVATVATALITAPMLPGKGIDPDFSDPEVWLAFLGAAGYLAIVSLLSFGIGAIVRSSAGSIASALGLLLVLPTVVQIFAALTGATWVMNLGEFLPSSAGARMYGYGTVSSAGTDLIMLTPWQGWLVVAAWAAVLGVLATVLVKRRDV